MTTDLIDHITGPTDGMWVTNDTSHPQWVYARIVPGCPTGPNIDLNRIAARRITATAAREGVTIRPDDIEHQATPMRRTGNHWRQTSPENADGWCLIWRTRSGALQDA